MYDRMKGKDIVIKFDEWVTNKNKPKYYKIGLYDFMRAETGEFKGTEYYHFRGVPFEDYPELSIKAGNQAIFHVPVISFENHIGRWFDFDNCTPGTCYDITIEVARVTKKRIHIKSLIHGVIDTVIDEDIY